MSAIKGDSKARKFSIADAGGNTNGSTNKKGPGLAKELFTSADKYNVSLAPDFADNRTKINIVATAITIDMVLKESK
ncbi:phospholipid scramblase-related protein [Flaviaesturariibacter flavus]|uniref:phospholipid scramblase-related protein n=1 Tax=Flaviaesturariibacter flavus TaxID=2502780 RepID=UPI001A9D5D34